MGAPLGRLSWPQVYGVWGMFSSDRMARYRMKNASTGSKKRTKAIYHSPTRGYFAKDAVNAVSGADSSAESRSNPSASFHFKIRVHYIINRRRCTVPANFAGGSGWNFRFALDLSGKIHYNN